MDLIARIDFETHDSRPRAEFNANITAAMNVHREYHGPTLEIGETRGAPIRSDFAALRAAGVLEIERQFVPEE